MSQTPKTVAFALTAYGALLCGGHWFAAESLGTRTNLLLSTAQAADSETRLEAGLKYKVLPSLTLAGSAQVRMGISPWKVNSLLPEAVVKFRVVDALAFATGYRFNWDRNSEGDFRAKQRVFADALGKLRLQPFSAKARLRIQEEWRKTRKGNPRNESTLRIGVGLKWQATATVAPQIGVEHFLALEKLEAEQTRKWRTSIGAEWTLGQFELEGSYRLDLPVADEEGPVTHLIVLGGTYSL